MKLLISIAYLLGRRAVAGLRATMPVVVLLALLCPGQSAFAQEDQKAPPAERTLFERIGRLPAIKAVIDEVTANCIGDDRVNAFFSETAAEPERMAAFKHNLAQYICSVTGGPCNYTGKSMAEAHQNMGLTDNHFNTFLDIFGKALTKFGIETKDKKELLELLRGMRGDIVTQ